VKIFSLSYSKAHGHENAHRESNDQLDSCSGRTINHAVKQRDIDSRNTIVPPLEDGLGRATALTAVLRETIRVVGRVLVIEAPCAEDTQASIIRSSQTLLDIALVLYEYKSAIEEPIACGIRKNLGHTYAIEREVVGIATGKVEILAVEHEFTVLDSDEPLRDSTGLLRSGVGTASQEAEGDGTGCVEEHRKFCLFSIF
jgi:hypothetical protein